MSVLRIYQYYKEFEDIKRFSGSINESTINGPFKNLLNYYAQSRNLLLVPEIQLKLQTGYIRPDGTLRNALTFDCGYWESKDTKDRLEDEINNKFRRGYPKSNIIFEDSETAILYQEGVRIGEVPMLKEPKELDFLLTEFVSHERPEVRNFNKAIETFTQDLPKILQELRRIIDEEAVSNPMYRKQRDKFLLLCKDSINPSIGLEDVREMLIQHILTEEIFVSIFDNADFHRENNIANVLYEVERTFFKGETKYNLLRNIRPYYDTIKARANEMVSHSDKQGFLKILYENFYKAYNPKSADRMGIVYTPNEIVKFMINSTDYLLDKHFGKTLGEQGVEILDPCTGTGTFITEIIEHIPAYQLEQKYLNELHANEMGLLPYYVANLNIEAVYQAKMQDYKQFHNLCFVDTLDNTNPLSYEGKQTDAFGSLSLENVERIKKQNQRKISVIIGNPPYNANQKNENDNNKNREYPEIDKRIKETYIKESTAQKTKQYDMYKRFIRWASDRVHDDGFVVFVVNRSFIDKKQDDGFRKSISKEFDYAYVYDLGGDVRSQGADAIDNVFGIMIGVAIVFLVKNKESLHKKAKIYYHCLPNMESKEAKLELLRNQKIEKTNFELITPDEKNNWINITDNDFEDLTPICNKQTKLGRNENAIFQLYTSPYKTNRDEWVFDKSADNLLAKIKYFIDKYNQQVDSGITDNDNLDYSIKWSSTLKKYLYRKVNIENYGKKVIIDICIKPFVKSFYYADKLLSDRLTENHYKILGKDLDKENIMITINEGGRLALTALVTNKIPSYSFYILDATQTLPLYRYTSEGERIENITDWALNLFRAHYDEAGIQRLDIFHYVYGVLHNPAYRQKYEQNLKRDFPRIPLYENFSFWAEAGRKLMDLHLHYETTAPYELERIDIPLKTNTITDQRALYSETGEKLYKELSTPRTKLKADKVKGIIFLDEETTLQGIPKIAWKYKLGNRSALEWVLDQYKEKKPRDETIREHFNTYRFADYKEHVIDLLQRVCTVSVKTMEIVSQMEKASI